MIKLFSIRLMKIKQKMQL